MQQKVDRGKPNDEKVNELGVMCTGSGGEVCHCFSPVFYGVQVCNSMKSFVCITQKMVSSIRPVLLICR